MAIGSDINSPLNQYLSEGTSELRAFVSTRIISDNKLELERITRYYLFWNFYEGLHYKDFNDNMIAFNYVRAFIDKVNVFLLGDKGCTFKVVSYDNDAIDEELEKNVEKLILGTWRKNKYQLLLNELLQMGSICGDAWVGLNWDDGKKYVKVSLFDSRQCFPIFNNGDINDLESITIRQPLEKNSANYALRVIRYTKNNVEYWYQKNVSQDVSKAEKLDYKPFTHDLGFIPVVHFKNKPQSSGYFSKSDAHDIMKLNKVYNEMHQEFKTIIDYFAAPTTVVTGASVRNLKRGIGNIWSGLPPEANVFNLGLDVDLSSMITFLEKLKTGMHEISDVPENVLGKTQAISGTSAAALKLTYQPLVQQADQKALMYGEGIVELNDMILRFYALYNKKDEAFKKLPKNFTSEYRVEPIFAYGFPTDRMNMLQEMQMEDQLKLTTKRSMMNRLGYNNVPDLITQIEEERIAEAQLLATINEITMPQNSSGNGGGEDNSAENTDAEDENSPKNPPQKFPGIKGNSADTGIEIDDNQK